MPYTTRTIVLTPDNLLEAAHAIRAALQGRVYSSCTTVRYPDGYADPPTWKHRQTLLGPQPVVAWPATQSVEINDTAGLHLLSGDPPARASAVAISPDALCISFQPPSGNRMEWTIVFTDGKQLALDVS